MPPVPPPRRQRTPRLSYKAAGVDIDAGNEAVRRIARLVGRTRRPEQLGGIGGFSGLFAVPKGYRDPVLAACTDGVGTKLAVAQAAGRHDTVGIDLVAMCVNDLVVTGAEPLFLLDYLATGKVRPDHVETVVAGIVEGCEQAGCTILGGETAEHPGTMEPEAYDLSAFAVGVVEREGILGPERVREGDVLVGLASSGPHANGYSLIRRALLQPEGPHALDAVPPPLAEPLVDALLRPTRIYVRAVLAARDLPGGGLHAASHITGGGLVENVPRMLPEHLAAEIDLSILPRPPVFDLLAECGVPEEEMRRTFNCGIGFVLAVDPAAVGPVLDTLTAHGETAEVVGSVEARPPGDPPLRLRPT